MLLLDKTFIPWPRLRSATGCRLEPITIINLEQSERHLFNLNYDITVFPRIQGEVPVFFHLRHVYTWKIVLDKFRHLFSYFIFFLWTIRWIWKMIVSQCIKKLFGSVWATKNILWKAPSLFTQYLLHVFTINAFRSLDSIFFFFFHCPRYLADIKYLFFFCNVLHALLRKISSIKHNDVSRNTEKYPAWWFNLAVA